MSENFVEIIGRDGRRRRARRGDILADRERFSLPMTFMDAALRDALVERYKGDAIRVVDAAGLPAGHRPGFLFDSDMAGGESAAEAAYREKVARLDVVRRKRQSDEGGDHGQHHDQRQEMDAQAQAEAAYEARCA